MATKKAAARRGATKKVEKQPKRKIQLSLPGWMSVNTLGWAVLPVVLLGLFVGGRQMMDQWLIERIEVKGNLVVWSPDDIKNQVSWVLGDGFYSADLNLVYDSILNMPLIHNVQVRKRWPDRIEINVSEDIPMAVWNGSQIIGINGDLMSIPEHFNVDKLAAIDGNNEYLDESIKSFRLVQQVMGGSNIKIQRLDISDTGSMSLHLSNEWDVFIGSAHLEKRALRLKKLLTGLPADEVSAVDLRYGKGAAIQWRTEQEKG